MLDKVQMAMERLAPEIEEYKKRMIFSDEEISKIVETRRMFETKLQRTQKKLDDFLHYVSSEMRLERIRNRRIKKAGTGFSETDELLNRNILRIYSIAFHYFDEPIILKDFTEYCIKKGFYEEMKEGLFEKCLKNLKDTDLWVFCAQRMWEVDDIEGARGVFLKCLGVNTDRRLLIEFFRLECLYSERVNKMNKELGVEVEEEGGGVECGDVALAIFKSFVDKMTEVEYKECLDISEMVDGLSERIVNVYSSR